MGNATQSLERGPIPPMAPNADAAAGTSTPINDRAAAHVNPPDSAIPVILIATKYFKISVINY